MPGAAGPIDFDDIAYSKRLRRILVPARRSGLYLVEPRTGEAERVAQVRGAESADEGRGLLFVLHGEEKAIDVVDPRSGRIVSSTATRGAGDYIRYVRSTGELWITEPAGSPPGIEMFALQGRPALTPRRSGFVAVPGGPEGFASSASRQTAYAHAGADIVTIDVRSRTVSRRWSTGCRATHGFPRVGERDGLATLVASKDGLALEDEVRVPESGHCLTADGIGHYWTCDAERGRVLRFGEP